MKHLLTSCCLTLALVIACAAQAPPSKPSKQSDAEKYAAELARLLTEYQKQLSMKIKAEQQAYTDAARLYDDAFRENAFASLSLDRTADAQHAQRALRSGSLTPEKLLDDVYAYAQHDFDQTRSVYQLGLDSYRTYLSNLNSLEAGSQKIGALIKTLNDLARPASLRARLTEIRSYQQSFTKQLHFSDCSLADSLQGINTKKKAALDQQVQSVKDQIASAPDGTDLRPLQDRMTALAAESRNLQSEIDRLTAQRGASGGFTPGATGAAGRCEVK